MFIADSLSLSRQRLSNKSIQKTGDTVGHVETQQCVNIVLPDTTSTPTRKPIIMTIGLNPLVSIITWLHRGSSPRKDSVSPAEEYAETEESKEGAGGEVDKKLHEVDQSLPKKSLFRSFWNRTTRRGSMSTRTPSSSKEMSEQSGLDLNVPADVPSIAVIAASERARGDSLELSAQVEFWQAGGDAAWTVQSGQQEQAGGEAAWTVQSGQQEGSESQI